MSINKKYELLDNDVVKSWDGRTLKRIRALVAIAAIGIQVNRGCFSGTLDEFEAAVTKTHGDNQNGKEYRCLIEFIRLRTAAFSWDDVKGEEA